MVLGSWKTVQVSSGVRQLEDSSSPARVFYNVGGGGIIQLGDSSSPTCAFYNVEEGSTM